MNDKLAKQICRDLEDINEFEAEIMSIRIVEIFSRILKNKKYIDVFSRYYFDEYKKIPTIEEAKEFVSKFDYLEESKYDEHEILKTILSHRIGENTILELIKIRDKDSKKKLSDIGIKASKEMISIAKNHPALRELFRETNFKYNYLEMIGNLDICGNISSGSARFGGVNKRYRKIAISDLEYI